AQDAAKAAKEALRVTKIRDEISRAVGKGVRRLRRKVAQAIEPAPEAETPSEPQVNDGVTIRGHMGPRYDDILTPEAQAFLAALHREFDARRRELLAERAEKQKRYDEGALPDFLPETAELRARDDWKVAEIPADLLDRRVEITGPVD